MKIKIIFVEDELELRDTVHELLTLNNFEVNSFEDGAKALQSLKSWVPDVIVCDIMMPNCNGYEFYELLRKNQKYNHIPFIFLTAKKPEEELNKANLIGVEAFVTKPFKSKDLIEIIETKIKRNSEIKNNYNILDINFDDKITNEIYTPLKRIIGIGHYINENKNFEENLNLINTINISAEKINSILTNLITYQKIISNNYYFQKESEIEIQNCFKEIYDKIKGNSNRKFHAHLKQATVRMPRQDLLLIIYEIMNNAIKYSPEGSVINISGGLKLKNRYYMLSIRDQGIGMLKKEIRQIGPFVQFHKKESHETGLGIGLYLSKKILENYNGKLIVKSEIDNGTEVEIHIPICN
jgi:two-component system, sensor histidine kinase and response regulator